MAPRHLICVDRDGHTLTLHKRNRFGSVLRKKQVWPIAVGMVGHKTPRGLYVIDDRDLHPTWTLGDFDWVREAGLTPGAVLPYGDPNNPILGRWLGLKDAKGVGIHGTADESSIGKDASHGCIRMRVDDVLELYPSAPLRTPVYIA